MALACQLISDGLSINTRNDVAESRFGDAGVCHGTAVCKGLGVCPRPSISPRWAFRVLGRAATSWSGEAVGCVRNVPARPGGTRQRGRSVHRPPWCTPSGDELLAAAPRAPVPENPRRTQGERAVLEARGCSPDSDQPSSWSCSSQQTCGHRTSRRPAPRGAVSVETRHRFSQYNDTTSLPRERRRLADALGSPGPDAAAHGNCRARPLPFPPSQNPVLPPPGSSEVSPEVPLGPVRPKLHNPRGRRAASSPQLGLAPGGVRGH